MATFITRQMISYVDLRDFEDAFKNILENVKKIFKENYSTKCKKCGAKSEVIHFRWERQEKDIKIKRLKDAGEINRNLVSITYKCENCGYGSDKPEKYDIDVSTQPYLNNSPKYLINKKLQLKHSSEAKDYFDLFTPRNLFFLSVIYDEINKISVSKIKDLMRLVFSSCLTQSSKLIMYTEKGIRPEVSERSKSWIATRFHIQRNYLEKNPLINFKNSFETVFKAKKESNNLIEDCIFVDTFEDLFKGKGNVLIINDSVDYINDIPPESIDYVITDPPFVKDVNYIELSQLWLFWLFNKDPDFEKEIRCKESMDNYKKQMINVFEKIKKVLKKDKYLTVTYRADEPKMWDTMIQCPTEAGFYLTKIVPHAIGHSIGARYRQLMAKGTPDMAEEKHKLILGYFYLTFNKKEQLT
ncbi:MAG: hypothetical protein HY755_00135 [Nitrospirae bacterium]|nr:hypothetical protein [Nitrospirota bacterium]